ncbi:MAG: hypothetical protein ACYDD1_19960 [Caulobacteraceae bacterium]
MRPLAIAAGCLALAGRVTATANAQSPTATEMPLRSHPAERACAELNLRFPVGAKAIRSARTRAEHRIVLTAELHAAT